MKKTGLFLLVLLYGNYVHSQSYGEYFRRYDIYGGAMMVKTRNYIYGVKYPKTPSSPAVYDTIGGHRTSALGPWVGFGLNLPFVTFAQKNMSVGMHAAANMALADGISINVPIGLQYRFGTDASQDSEKNFGFSVGGGYNIFFISGDLGEGIFKYPYVSPEINYNFQRFGLFKLKAYLQFTEQYFHEKVQTETHHTYMKVPVIFSLAVCPNFDN